MKCSVGGCEKQSRARGMCKMHYTRDVRHGDVNLSRKAHVASEENEAALQRVLAEETDECIVWPLFRNADGYGKAAIGSHFDYVHRIVCERAHGPAPTDKPHVAHSCGNGAGGCCNKRHVRWADHLDNASDRRAHGTLPLGERVHSAKLTEEQVRLIKRKLADGAKGPALAEEFGVSNAAIWAIAKGRTWSWLQV